MLKPINLNHLLFHDQKEPTLSFFLSPSQKASEGLDAFFSDIQMQLQLKNKVTLTQILERNIPNIKKVLTNHFDKSHGFFISEGLQGFITLETYVETYYIIGNSFHVRPLLEELFVNPEYLVVNISLYDIKVYKGDFHHLEIIQHFEFEEMGIDMKSRVFTLDHLGLVPYKSILALSAAAKKVMEHTFYDSMPVLVTGLDEMKKIFLKNIPNHYGVISHIQEDFYEKTCVQILQKCKQFRFAIIDFYSARFKERLKKLMRSKLLISELSEIIEAIRRGKVVHLVIPTERKVYGYLNLETGEYKIQKKVAKGSDTVDILNELAEEVIKQGGKIQILAPHFFPQDSFVLAILREKL